MQFRHAILILGTCCAFTSGCFNDDSVTREMAAATAEGAKREAAEAARETEWKTIQINSQPQGAAIEMGDRSTGYEYQTIGYAPATVNVLRHKDDGSLAGMYVIRGVPTAPEQFQQVITLSPWLNSNCSNVTFYMYNNGK
jgi:hypothetical protein